MSWSVVTGTALLAACTLITGVIEDRQVGRLGYPDYLAISVQDSAVVGQPLGITVRTLGSDGCWRGDGTDMEVSGLTATITPYDVDRETRGTACTQMLVEITHTANLTFGLPGEAHISIRGRDGTVTRTVTVR
jgi:hypothetical protein